jgi:predicted transcriptional regulator
VEDDQTRKQYVLIDQDLHARAMQALRQQEDLAAIQGGIEDLEAGRFVTLEAADAEIRSKLGFGPRTT